jgi:CotH kinase protein
MQPLKERLQSRQVPAALLDSGVLGGLLQRSDWVDDVPNGGTLFPRTGRGTGDGALDPFVFRRKARVGEVLFEVHSGADSTFPDSSLPPAVNPAPDWMVVSVAVKPRDLEVQLTDYRSSIERRAEASFYRDGALVYRARAGLQLHGGNSRKPGQVHSYRLHFRDRYGPSSMPRGFLFGGALDPVRTFILRRVAGSGFRSVLAYDIFRALGVEAPMTDLALFYLNGEFVGVIALTEHLSPRQLATRVGHEDFLVFRPRGMDTEASRLARNRLLMWALDNQESMNAGEAARYCDLDQLSRYILGFAFCNTRDWEQGAALLDLSDPGARWRWIPWDLDSSFDDPRWQAPFDRVLDDPREKLDSVPARLFGPLFVGDAGFRASFARIVTECINHRLTEQFLAERAGYYRGLLVSLGMNPVGRVHETFLKGRRLAVMEDLARRCGLGPVVRFAVDSDDPNLGLRVDGYEHSAPFKGLYLAGQTVRVQASDPSTAGRVRWKLDGNLQPPGPLEVVLTKDRVVTAVHHEGTKARRPE